MKQTAYLGKNIVVRFGYQIKAFDAIESKLVIKRN